MTMEGKNNRLEYIPRDDLRQILLDEFEEWMQYGLGKWNERFGAWEYIIVYGKKVLEFEW